MHLPRLQEAKMMIDNAVSTAWVLFRIYVTVVHRSFRHETRFFMISTQQLHNTAKNIHGFIGANYVFTLTPEKWSAGVICVLWNKSVRAVADLAPS